MNRVMSKNEIMELYKAGKYADCEKMCRRILYVYPNSDDAETALKLLSKIRFMKEDSSSAKKAPKMLHPIKNDVDNAGTIDDDSANATQDSEGNAKVRDADESTANGADSNIGDAEKKLRDLVGLDNVKDEINENPTVDAVPVVRCKDCIHCEDGECRKHLGIYDVVSDMDFCSRGERKDKTE